MKTIFTLLILLSSFTVFGQKYTPKIIQDSTKTIYYGFTIEQSRKIAEKIKTGEICDKKTGAMQKEINLLKNDNEVCDSLVDSLQVNYKRVNEVNSNQLTIIKNKDAELVLMKDIETKQNETIGKQQKKIIRKNNLIKILTGTNILAILVIYFFSAK
jgi:hypothetical protein